MLGYMYKEKNKKTKGNVIMKINGECTCGLIF